MNAKNVLMLLLVVSLWGSSFTLLKLGLQEIPPVTLAFLRFSIVLPFLAAFAYYRRQRTLDRNILKDWKTFSLLGLTGVTLYHVFQNLGLRLTTASSSSLIVSANPVFIALLDHLYMKERLTLKRVLGVVVALTGVVLIIKPVDSSPNLGGAIGGLLSLGAALCWACYSVLGKKVLLNYDANTVTLLSMAFGTLFLLPSALALEKPVMPGSIWIWSLLLFLSLFCSGLAYLFWSKALEDVPATKAGVFLFFIPVVSVSVAHLVLVEPLDTMFTLGALLIMTGVVITERN